jgi:hypothetical protein
MQAELARDLRSTRDSRWKPSQSGILIRRRRTRAPDPYCLADRGKTARWHHVAKHRVSVERHRSGELPGDGDSGVDLCL